MLTNGGGGGLLAAIHEADIRELSLLIGRVMIGISWKRSLKSGLGRVSAVLFPKKDSKSGEV